jgi:hypothetical protein
VPRAASVRKLGGVDILTQDIGDQPFLNFTAQLRAVKDEPRSLVLVPNGILEVFIHAVVRERCKEGKRIAEDSRGFPYSVRLVLLHEAGIVRTEQFRALDRFRKLRNRAAHEPLFALNDEDLKGWAARKLSPADFHTVCSGLVGSVWTQFSEVLIPDFLPMLDSKVRK